MDDGKETKEGVGLKGVVVIKEGDQEFRLPDGTQMLKFVLIKDELGETRMRVANANYKHWEIVRGDPDMLGKTREEIREVDFADVGFLMNIGGSLTVLGGSGELIAGGVRPGDVDEKEKSAKRHEKEAKPFLEKVSGMVVEVL